MITLTGKKISEGIAIGKLSFYKRDIKEIKERFWDMFVVDCFINNNDRHNGNWGIFVFESENKISLAPVYDNGNSLFPKHSEEKTK